MYLACFPIVPFQDDLFSMADLRQWYIMKLHDGRRVVMSNAELARLNYAKLRKTKTGDDTPFGCFLNSERELLYQWAFRATNNHRVNKCAYLKKRREERTERRLNRKAAKAKLLAARLKDYEAGGDHGLEVSQLKDALKGSKEEVRYI